MSALKEKVKEILERLPEDKMFSALDYLEFLEKRSEISIRDNGREVIIGPNNNAQEVFKVFERWRAYNSDKKIKSEDVKVASILTENHEQLTRIVAPYAKSKR